MNEFNWEEAKVCGFVQKDDPKAKPCDGTLIVQRTGKKAKSGVRYCRCNKCGNYAQIFFKPAAPAEYLGRSEVSERQPGGRKARSED